MMSSTVATVTAGSFPTQWWYLVMEDVIWWTTKADSHIWNHVEGFSNQNPGRLMEELTAARMNSLPEAWRAWLLQSATAAAAVAAVASALICSRLLTFIMFGGGRWAVLLGLPMKDVEN